MEAVAGAAPRVAVDRDGVVASPRWASERLERSRPAVNYLKRTTSLGRTWQLVRELPRNFLFYALRASPYPVSPGLMILGNPNRGSPVLVSSFL